MIRERLVGIEVWIDTEPCSERFDAKSVSTEDPHRVGSRRSHPATAIRARRRDNASFSDGAAVQILSDDCEILATFTPSGDVPAAPQLCHEQTRRAA
jgi:hypothetical protein